MMWFYLIMAVLVFSICLVQELRAGSGHTLGDVGLLLLLFVAVSIFWPFTLLTAFYMLVGDNP